MTLDKYFDGTIESGSYTESRIQEFDRNGEDIGKKLNDTHQMGGKVRNGAVHYHLSEIFNIIEQSAML